MMEELKITAKTEINGWNKARIQRLLDENNAALERAILYINSLQTRDEQATRTTKYWNTRGWCMVDAKRGARWATCIVRGYGLNMNDSHVARRVMKKYWRQLLVRVAEKNQASSRT